MRTAADIRAQQLAYNQSNLESAVSGLPPSYVEGFKHTLDKDYRVTIGAGLTTVQGTRVEITEDTLLRDVDWLCSKAVDGGSFYYVYISRTRVLYVDRTAPAYSGKYFYFQHPTFGYRAIGKLWLDGTSSQIVWCSSQFTAYTNQVTIAQTGYLGYADYYISTDEDASILIQAANDYLYRAFSGGTINLLRGVYTTQNTIYLSSFVEINGEGGQSLIKGDTTGSTSNPPTGSVFTINTGKTNCKIKNIKIQNIEPTDTEKALVYVYLAGNCEISNCYLEHYDCYAVRAEAWDLSISNNTFIGGSSKSLYSLAITTYYRINISNNKFLGGTTSLSGAMYITTDNTNIVNNIIDGKNGVNRNIGDGIASVATVQNIIASNQCINCDVRGISDTGTNTQIYGNTCYNNGDDTGIANENEDNFLGTGTGTYALLNSWQQPVDAEPSYGTMHPKTQLLYSGDPSTTNVQSIDLSSYVPVGTKAIYVYFNVSSTTEGDYVYMTESTGAQAYAITAVIGAGGAGYSQGIMPVDANRLVYFKINNTRITGVDITMHYYWL